jgi:hypothetical protein
MCEGCDKLCMKCESMMEKCIKCDCMCHCGSYCVCECGKCEHEEAKETYDNGSTEKRTSSTRLENKFQ